MSDALSVALIDAGMALQRLGEALQSAALLGGRETHGQPAIYYVPEATALFGAHVLSQDFWACPGEHKLTELTSYGGSAGSNTTAVELLVAMQKRGCPVEVVWEDEGREPLLVSTFKVNAPFVLGNPLALVRRG